METYMLLKYFLVLFLSADPSNTDYSVKLEYYTKSIPNREWSIEFKRTGKDVSIAVDNYRGETFEKAFDLEKYLSLVKKLNAAGIWSIRDCCPPNSPNGYYLIEVSSPKGKNSFKAEANVPSSGRCSGITEIMRNIENNAILVIYDRQKEKEKNR
jgi:hypothetical protein